MTFFQPPRSTGGPQFDTYVQLMRPRWGWFVALGALAAVLGLVALVLTVSATIVSVVTIGIFMILIGAVEIAVGFRARTWGRALYWELAGLLYIVAGAFAVAEPLPASLVITLLLGAGLLATGLVRLFLGWRMHDGQARGPLLLAGGITALLGLIIVIGWPLNSLFVLGTLLGIDLLFSGMGWIFFGLRLRSLG